MPSPYRTLHPRKPEPVFNIASPRPTLAALLTLALAFGACVSTPDGLRLTAPAEQGFLTAELSLCDALVPLAASLAPPPISNLGAIAAPMACQGSEALFKAALDKVTAAPPPTGAPSLAPASHPSIWVPGRGYAVWAGARPIGYVPTKEMARAVHSPQVQRYMAEMVGKEGGR